MRSSNSFLAILAACAVLACSGIAYGVEFIAAGGNYPDLLGNLNDPLNWDTGAVPSGSAQPDVRNGQIVWLDSPLPKAQGYYFGGNAVRDPSIPSPPNVLPRDPVTFYVLPGADLYLNYKASSKASLKGHVNVGYYYDATVIQTGGTVRPAKQLWVGRRGDASVYGNIYGQAAPQATGRYELQDGLLSVTTGGFASIGTLGGKGQIIQTGGTFQVVNPGWNWGEACMFIGSDQDGVGHYGEGEVRVLGGTFEVSRVVSLGRNHDQYAAPPVTPGYPPNDKATFAMSQDAVLIFDLLEMVTSNTNLELIIDSDRDFNVTPTGLYTDGQAPMWNAPGFYNKLNGNLIVTLKDGYRPSYMQEWKVITSYRGFTGSFVTTTEGFYTEVRDGLYNGSPVKELYLICTLPEIAKLDIKPGDCPNNLTVNLQGKGRLPMAILGSARLDVSTIDVNTISIGGVAIPVKAPSIDDVSAPAGEEECACQTGVDGYADLVLHFSQRDVIQALGLDLMSPGTVVPVTVEGYLTNGAPFRATDCITLEARE